MKELLGHQEISMTMRYAHLAPGRLREAVACFDGFWVEQAEVKPSLNGAPAHTAIGV